MKVVKYASKIWLTPLESPSTATVTCYHGELPECAGADLKYFVEISDSHTKVRFCRDEDESLEEFRSKLNLLRNSLEAFIHHIDKTKLPKSGI